MAMHDPRELSPADRDAVAGREVMAAIGRLLPPELRGAYRAHCRPAGGGVVGPRGTHDQHAPVAHALHAFDRPQAVVAALDRCTRLDLSPHRLPVLPGRDLPARL